jgi:hypothetical protein
MQILNMRGEYSKRARYGNFEAVQEGQKKMAARCGIQESKIPSETDQPEKSTRGTKTPSTPRHSYPKLLRSDGVNAGPISIDLGINWPGINCARIDSSPIAHNLSR